MKTTKTTEKTIKQVQEKNERRVLKAVEKITKQTDNAEKLVNVKAIETMQTLKAYGKDSKQFTDVSQQLITILVHSKLKQLYHNEKTSNEQLRKVNNLVTAYMATDGKGTRIDTMIAELNKLYTTKYNTNGELVTECKDKKQAELMEKRLSAVTSAGNNGGHDILNDAYLKLWSYIHNIDTASVNVDYLLTPFEIVIPSSKVYRKSGNVKPEILWRKTATNIIKEILKEIERHIDNNKSIKDNFVAYADREMDIDGESIRQYYRVNPLYCDEVVDFNGKISAITANQTTEELFESVSEKCNLSTTESNVLHYHYYKNMSFDEVAKKFGVTTRHIEQTDERLKKKIVKSGMFAEYGLTEKADNSQKSKAVHMFTLNGEYITEFESLGKASDILNIDKGNISRVLNGKRQQTNGYIFKYNK